MPDPSYEILPKRRQCLLSYSDVKDKDQDKGKDKAKDKDKDKDKGKDKDKDKHKDVKLMHVGWGAARYGATSHKQIRMLDK